MMQSYACGFDHGNAETGLVLLDPILGPQMKTMPSAQVTGSLESLATMRTAPEGRGYHQHADALRTNEYVAQYGGIEYYVGELALSERREESTGRDDIGRYWSTRALIQLLTISGASILHNDYELYVVTGLPVATYTRENAEQVKKRLSGEFTFRLNGRVRHAVIHTVRVVMEAAGSLIAYDDEGEQSGPQGVIDIGGRTTDLYVAEDQRPITNWCRGKDFGVETVGDMLNTRFITSYGHSMRAIDIRKSLRGSLTGTLPLVNGAGRPVPAGQLQEWVGEAIKGVSEKISGFVSAVWKTNDQGLVAGDISPVLVIGGGAYYFYKQVKAIIPHAQMMVRPELANAQGYAALAKVIQDRHLEQMAAS